MERDLMQDLNAIICWLESYATHGGRITPPKALDILVAVECARNRIFELQTECDILEQKVRCMENGRKDRL